MTDFFANAALVAATLSPDGQSGGVGASVKETDRGGPVVKTEAGGDYEGKRPERLIDLAVEKRPASVNNKRVNFASASPADAKETTLMKTDDDPRGMYCCSLLGSNDVLTRWCAEVLDGEGQCRFTSHHSLSKVDVRPRCRYILALKKGRGGVSAYVDKWLDEDELEESDRSRLDVLGPRSVSEWTEEFHACRVSGVMGTDTSPESRRKLFTESKETFKLTYTPQRAKPARGAAVEVKGEGVDGVSSTSPDTWVDLEPREMDTEWEMAETLLTYQVKSKEGNTERTARDSTEAGFKECDGNFKILAEHLSNSANRWAPGLMK